MFVVQEPDRAVQFRNLGRGWVFVLVRRHKRIFKVWFESIRRVEWNHQVLNACWENWPVGDTWYLQTQHNMPTFFKCICDNIDGHPNC